MVTLLVFAPPALAQQQHVEVLETVELTFTSARTYEDPHRQGQLSVTLTAPDGQPVTVAGFWDGGDAFRARFAPSTPGTWTYHSTAADPTNTGLHDVTGEIEVIPYSGTNPFRSRGWPRVSTDGRHLTYGDDSPLFLLADWAAEVAWRSVPEDVTAYLDDRAEKGFAAVQVVSSSHNRHFPEGVTNQLGEPLHPPFAPDYLNPRYFDYLDWLVSEANERGMAVMLYPIWAAMTEIHEQDNDWYGWYVPAEDALFRARYVASRYAGHNVIWVIGGDQYYHRLEARAFWRDFARTVEEASGGGHLMTAHSSGWSGTFQFFNETEDEWLDFHSYTPGHWAGGNWSYDGAAAGTMASTGKPLFNIESNFEDLFHRFWDYTADTTATFRMQDIHAREAAYWGALSGALAGYSYGANGIWQWTTEETVMYPGDLWPRHTAVESLDYPGSSQAPLFRQAMESLPWTDLTPQPHLLLDAEGEQHVAISAGMEVIVAYLPAHTVSVTIATNGLEGDAVFQWFDPRTGQRLGPIPTPGPVLDASPPDDRDWLLIISPA